MARALFDAVYATARERGVERVYWHTQQYNGAARSLYDQVGRPTSFVVYEHDLDEPMNSAPLGGSPPVSGKPTPPSRRTQMTTATNRYLLTSAW